VFISSKSKKLIFLHKLLWCPRSAAQAPDKMLTNNTVVSAMPAMPAMPALPTLCNVLKEKEELSYDLLSQIFLDQNPKTLCVLSQVSKDWKAVANSNDIWKFVHGITKQQSKEIFLDLETKRCALYKQLWIAMLAENKAAATTYDKAVCEVVMEIHLFHRMLLDPISVRKTWIWVKGAQPQWEIIALATLQGG
jgi:hypothetical protein